jgi:hypothetical protein
MPRLTHRRIRPSHPASCEIISVTPHSGTGAIIIVSDR